MNWYQRRIVLANASAQLAQAAQQIQQYADEINSAKSRYLQQSSTNALWKNPMAIQRINMSLNQAWQAVVSAARSLNLAGDVKNADVSVNKAIGLLHQVCQWTDCANESLSRINKMLGDCFNLIRSLV